MADLGGIGGIYPPTRLLASQSFEFILIIIFIFHTIFSIMSLIYNVLQLVVASQLLSVVKLV